MAYFSLLLSRQKQKKFFHDRDATNAHKIALSHHTQTMRPINEELRKLHRPLVVVVDEDPEDVSER